MLRPKNGVAENIWQLYKEVVTSCCMLIRDSHMFLASAGTDATSSVCKGRG